MPSFWVSAELSVLFLAAILQDKRLSTAIVPRLGAEGAAWGQEAQLGLGWWAEP